jgi:voltage-gated potassium channel Kch
VLVVGFGRFGQIAAQVLLARGFELTIIDNDVNRIEEARRFGTHIHYGDGTRLDVLRAAGAERVRLIAVCTNGTEATSRIAVLAREAFPDTPVLVRSYDRRHSIELIRIGVAGEVRETFDSALAFGREALVVLGDGVEAAQGMEAEVRRRDRERLRLQVEGGLFAGLDLRRVRPEPLTPPRRAAAPAPADGGGGGA